MKLVKEKQTYTEIVEHLKNKMLQNNTKKIVIDLNKKAITEYKNILKSRYPKKEYQNEEIIEKLLNITEKVWLYNQGEKLDMWISELKQCEDEKHIIMIGIINTKNINKFKKLYRYGGIEMIKDTTPIEEIIYSVTQEENKIYQSKRYFDKN